MRIHDELYIQYINRFEALLNCAATLRIVDQDLTPNPFSFLISRTLHPK